MKNPRNPIKVVQQIKEVIPEEFHEMCDWLMNDFSYRAPELVGLCFSMIGEFLFKDCLPDKLTKDWHFEVVSIYSGKSIE